jgi:hypothetical protein
MPNQRLASERISSPWKRELTQKEFYELQNNIRQTFIQALGGAALLFGLYFTAQTLRISQATLRTTQQGQITERFSKAIEYLGDKERLMVRLGGIYALERIAKDSEYDHWAVMEVLTAFVREQTQEHEASPQVPLQERPERKSPEEPQSRADIQAVLTVLGRRTRTFGNGETQRLNLERTQLQGVSLYDAHLEEAALNYAHLEKAFLNGAHLQGAMLHCANLEKAALRDANLKGAWLLDANLEGAYLEGADLRGAGLEFAHLEGAHLEGADLREAGLEFAHLEGAHLEGADLREVKNLTQEQVNTTRVDEYTKLPEGFTKPAPCSAKPE